MEKRALIVANWKMNKTIAEAKTFIEGLKLNYFNKVYIAAPFTMLYAINEMNKNKKISIGGQNLYFEEKGAFTGEISASMLKDVGASFVIIGHSERRHFFEESDEVIQKKITRALKEGLEPIFCVGESLDQRENMETEEVLIAQLEEGLKDFTIDEMEKIVIAYEPLWAIGTGIVATKDQAEHAHQFIRHSIAKLFTEELAQKIYILYGGSVTPSNIEGLLMAKDIDGVLVGGASLDVESFNQIISTKKRLI